MEMSLLFHNLKKYIKFEILWVPREGEENGVEKEDGQALETACLLQIGQERKCCHFSG
jgi:hypothetical protein